MNSMFSNGPFGESGRIVEEAETTITTSVDYQFSMAVAKEQEKAFQKIISSPAFVKAMEKEALNMVNRSMRGSAKGGKQWFDDVVIEKMIIK